MADFAGELRCQVEIIYPTGKLEKMLRPIVYAPVNQRIASETTPGGSVG